MSNANTSPPAPPGAFPVIDAQLAKSFLSALCSIDQSVLQTFDDIVLPNGDRRGDKTLARALSGSFDSLAPALAHLNAAGAGVFVQVNRSATGQRGNNFVTELTALFVDSDTGIIPLEKFRLSPSIRVGTPQGEHSYWLLVPEQPVELFTDAQKQLIAHFGTDKSINNLDRVLRLPGYFHRKGAPTRIDHVWFNYDAAGNLPRYTIDQVMAAYPRAAVAPKVPAPSMPRIYAPPLPGAAPSFTGEANSGRNTQLTGAAGRLRAAGASEAVILTALREENATFAAPLGDDEVASIARSIGRYETKAPEQDLLDGISAVADSTPDDSSPSPRAKNVTIVTAPGTGLGARNWSSDLIRNGQGEVKAGIGNVLTILKHHDAWKGVLGFNSRALTPCFMKRPPIDLVESTENAIAAECSPAYPRAIAPHEIGEITLWISKSQQMGTLQSHIVADALLTVAHRQEFDPVRDYLDALPDWDGVERLEEMLITYCGAADTPYIRAVSKRWMILAVSRAMRPGCIGRTVLILEGEQEAGKSTFLKRLFSPAFYGEDLPPSLDKDAKQYCHGPWGIELSELTATQKSVEPVKAFISLPEDRFRPPYGRAQETFKRGCVFAGTTNADEYLKDETGNTRFWPVKCRGAIDHEGVARDRDLLWAEALHWYDNPDRHEVSWLTAEERPLAAIEQEARMESNEILESRIAHALAHGVKALGFDFLASGGTQWAIPPSVQSITVTEIVTYVFPNAHDMSRGIQTRIGGVLSRKMKWAQHFIRENGIRVRRYYRPGCAPLESEL